MKQFAATPPEQDEWVFKYRLSRARRCTENAFGILANRLGCLLTTLRQEPQNVVIMMNACIALHKMLRTRAQLMLYAGVGIHSSLHL